MKFLENEDGVSEIVGTLLILLIAVVFLGTLQTYEVPRWNKEVELEHYDIAYDDFITLRSNLEDVAIKDMARTAKINMGTRYPDRFMLQNPGPGAYGTISTYPLNVNISYKTSTGNITWRNYSSMGIEYQLNSILELPKLVYENSLIIEDYETSNVSIDDYQTMITDDNIYIPLIGGRIDSISSISVETLTIIPIGKSDYEQQIFSSMNATLETRYPDVWNGLYNNIDLPAGSNFSIVGNTIQIK